MSERTDDRKPTLEVVKQNLTFVASVAALLYALGWISETLMYKHFGMGDMGISHEQAISAGVATFVCLSPFVLAVVLAKWSRANVATKHGYILPAMIATLVVEGLLLLMKDGHFVQFQDQFYPHRSFSQSIAADAFLGAAGAFFIFTAVHRRRINEIDWRLFVGVGMFVVKWLIFSNHLLPCLNHSLGGFIDQDVYIGLTDDSQLCKPGQPCRAQAFLLAQDSNAILFAQGFHIDRFSVNASGSEEDPDTTISPMDGRPVRIPNSKILWMKQPSQSLRVFRN